MKVKGVVRTAKEYVVEVDPKEVLSHLKSEWLNTLDGIGKARYINLDGLWEYWEDTGHGSGMTETYRPANEEEKQVNRAFKVLFDLTKKV